MDRREFLKSSAASVLGLGVGGAGTSALAQEAPKPSARIKRYNILGRTGLKVSDVSFGGGGLSDATLVEKAVELGVSFIDTAPDYRASEETIGKVMPKYRDKVVLATKICNLGTYPQHLPINTPAEKIIEVVEASLKRLQTDRIDVLHVHAVGEGATDGIERLKDPEVHKAFGTLKKAGKVRFLATSSHGPNNMVGCLDYAIECGQYDVIQPSYNFMKFPGLDKVLEKAKQKNIGVIAMKTQAGAKESNIEKFKAEGRSFAQAALKWALSNPAVSAAIITMRNMALIDEYVAASGEPLTAADQRLLDRYAASVAASYCRTGCGQCLGACPRRVAIADILRYNMYFEDYGHERMAMESYANLPQESRPLACAGCSAPCQSACPHGLPVRTALLRAHENLSLA